MSFDSTLAEAQRRLAEEQAASGQAKVKSVVERDPAVVATARAARDKAALDAANRRTVAGGMTWPETARETEKATGNRAIRSFFGAPGLPADIYRAIQIGSAKAQEAAQKWLRPKDEQQTSDQILSEGDKSRMIDPATVEKWTSPAWLDYWKSKGLPIPDRFDPNTRTAQVGGEIGDFAGGAAATAGVGGLVRTGAAGAAGLARGAVNVAREGAAALPEFGAGARQVGQEALLGLRETGRQTGAGAIAGAGTGGVEQVAPDLKTPASIILGTVAGNYAGGTRQAQSMLRQYAGGNVSGDQMRQAEAIFRRATEANVPITRAQAIDMVTRGGSSLTELQRIVESGNSTDLKQFFAGAPDRAREYFDRTAARIAPASPEPETLGPRVAAQAGEIVEGAKRDVNATTRPDYQRFEGNQADPNLFATLMQDPKFAQMHERMLTDPDFASYRTGANGQLLPADSVAMIDRTRQMLENETRDLRAPNQPGVQNMNAARAAGIDPSVDLAQGTASGASRPIGPSQPGTPSPLEQVQATQARLREENVRPLEYGPEGQLQRTDSTEGAQKVLFPEKPIEGSDVGIRRTVAGLVADDARNGTNNAAELTRNYLANAYNEATQANIPGQAYTGPAKFFAQVRGNDQQARNLEAVVTSLPNGQQTWEAFRDMSEVFEAMGKRQPAGSKTAFNEEALKDFKGGGLTSGALKFIASRMESGKELLEKYALGRNSDEIARLLTDPGAAREFSNIVTRTAPGSVERYAGYFDALARIGRQVGPAAQDATQEPGVNAITVNPRPAQPAGGQP